MQFSDYSKCKTSFFPLRWVPASQCLCSSRPPTLPWIPSLFLLFSYVLKAKGVSQQGALVPLLFSYPAQDPKVLAFAQRSPAALLCRDHLPYLLMAISILPSSCKPWLTITAPCHPCWPLHMLTHWYCYHSPSTGDLSELLGL